ncbi:MAG TPA: sigma-70 family RNA polymerase sigma factor [Lacipirellulaceae bacterium]|nr:sigma-70 family RNA polymerase sigma factor [Lacipirellulaceae bacterium]
MKYVDAHTSNETTSHTQLSVVRGAQANDAGAWEALVRAYSRRIYRWCRRDGLQPADSANVVQDVLQALALNIGDFHRDRAGDTFRGWLRRITENKVHDHFRRENRQLARASGGTDAYQLLASQPDTGVEREEIASPYGAQEQALYAEVRNHVRNEFSERDWRLFWRIVVDGQPASEAAAEHGISANAARLVKMRVLRRFRQLVAEHCSESRRKS